VQVFPFLSRSHLFRAAFDVESSAFVTAVSRVDADRNGQITAYELGQALSNGKRCSIMLRR